jgi:hypothetical protein
VDNRNQAISALRIIPRQEIILLQTIMQMIVPLDMHGRVNSVTMAWSMSAQPAGTLVAGAVVEFTTTASLFLACSIAGVAPATASWFLTDIRHLETLAVSTNAAADALPKETISKSKKNKSAVQVTARGRCSSHFVVA